MYSTLSFICDNCKSPVNEEIFVPDTNMDDEEGSYSDEHLLCPSCEESFEIEINNRGGLILVTVNGNLLKDGSTSILYTNSINHESEQEREWREEYEWYASITHQSIYQYFSSSIENIKNMLTVNFDDRNQSEVFNRMLLAQSIACMEAYLSDTLISRVLTDPTQMERLFYIDKALKNEKINALDFLKDKELPKKIAKKHLSELIYHNLPKVQFLYENILSIEFNFGSDENKEQIYKAIQERHDIVHRNGKTKEGGDLRLIDKTHVISIIDNIYNFISKIEGNLKEYDDIPF